MSWDVLVAGGLVFDGHGGPPRRQDVAVADGRIVERGTDLSRGQAEQVVDASGRWVLPGLLDVHTHVDLEAEVAPGLPEVVRHGTTTAVMANCSLGLAFGNQRHLGGDPIVDCFARVENIPKHVLEQVAERASWSDTAGYLAHLDELPLGVNLVPMVPHSMLRIEVMGMADSIARDPSAAELDAMVALVEQAMREGYAGFSTDALPFHYLANDPNRRERIPAQWATRDELQRLTDVVRRWDRVWQATPPKDDKLEVLRTFLLSSGRLHGRPLRTTAVAALDVHANRATLALAKLLVATVNSRLFDGRLQMQALAAPFKVWGDGPITPLAEEIGPLRELNEPDLEDRESRRRLLDDPDWRARFRAMWNDGKAGRGLSGVLYRLRIEDYTFRRDLDEMVVDGPGGVEAWYGDTLGSVWRRLRRWVATGQGARSEHEVQVFERLRDAEDEAGFLIGLFREFDLGLRWYQVAANRDPRSIREAIFDPRLLPGFNDSGAHLTNMAFYDANLNGLRLAAQEGPLRVADHVRRLTREPARFFGLDVGTLDVGAPADVAVLDPGALQDWDWESTIRYVHRDAFDHGQLVNRPDGVVAATLVNGRLAWRDGELTAAVGRERLGRTLRAGRRARADQATELAA